MRAPSASELLGVWEQGLARSSAQRALLLLGVACADLPPERLARLSIGQRDGHLLALRECLFGPRLTSLAACPACAEKVEARFQVADLRVSPPEETPDFLTLTTGGFEFRFRLPDSLDLARLDPAADLAENQRRLLETCVIEARRDKRPVAVKDLPSEAVDAISDQMAAADPQAEIRLAMSCPQCAHHWQAPFDIASFIWTEIHAWVTRLLREVHALASAYGWREADILALSPWRRQAYLELIHA